MRHGNDNARRAGGFTLLEMALTMLIVAMLMTAIFTVVGGTTQLADGLEREQDRDGQRHSFSQFCERTFRSLPGNGLVRLRVKQSGNHYLSELALKNAPAVFAGGGGNGVTILATEEQANGYLRVVLKSLTEEEANASDSDKLDADKTPRLVLMENVSKCDWKVYEPRSQQWVTVWNEKMPLGNGGMRIFPYYPTEFDPPNTPQTPPQPTSPNPPPQQSDTNGLTKVGTGTLILNGPGGLRPSLLELTLAVAGDAEQRFVFWMPPAQTPQRAVPPPQAAPTNPDGTPGPNNGTNINVNAPPIPVPKP